MALAIDPSSPGYPGGSSTNATGVASGTATTGSFTAPAGMLILALADAGSTGSGPIGSSISDTGGLSWTLIGRSTAASNADEAVGWWAISDGAARTVSLSGTTNTAGKSVQPIVISGADTVNPIGATQIGTNGSTQGSISKSVTTTRRESWAFMALSDWNAASDPVVSTGSMYSKTTFVFHTVDVTSGFLYNSTTVAVGGTLTIATSGPSNSQNSWMMFELLPAKPQPVIVGMGQAVQRSANW